MIRLRSTLYWVSTSKFRMLILSRICHRMRSFINGLQELWTLPQIKTSALLSSRMLGLLYMTSRERCLSSPTRTHPGLRFEKPGPLLHHSNLNIWRKSRRELKRSGKSKSHPLTRSTTRRGNLWLTSSRQSKRSRTSKLSYQTQQPTSCLIQKIWMSIQCMARCILRRRSPNT